MWDNLFNLVIIKIVSILKPPSLSCNNIIDLRSMFAPRLLVFHVN